MRPFLLLFVLTIALIGQVTSTAQDKLVIVSQAQSVPAGAIENSDSISTSETISAVATEQQNAENAALNRETQIDQCMTTLRFDPAAALSIADQGVAVAAASNDLGTQSRLLNCKGDAHKALGDADAASDAYSAAVFIAEKTDDEAFLSIEKLSSIMQFQEARILRLSAQENFQKAFEAGNELRKLQKHLDKRLLEAELTKFEHEIAVLKSKAVETENKRGIEFIQQQQTHRNLRWQVVVLGSALLGFLLIIGLRQFFRNRRMRILSMTDDLTKLPNRQHILTFLGDQAKNAYQEEQPLSVIAFDIDNFKQINEKHGHEAGDRIIKAVADIANQALRRGDRVGRLGGKEFLVVLPGSPKKPAIDVAERLRRSVEVTDMETSAQALRASISVGVCEWNAGHESIDAFLKRTHSALDQAKDEGRNRVVDR